MKEDDDDNAFLIILEPENRSQQQSFNTLVLVKHCSILFVTLINYN